MKTNKRATFTPKYTERTAPGAPAYKESDEEALRRATMACMLWEKSFYEGAKSAANRIAELVPLVNPRYCGDIAIEAKTQMKLRHVPLWIARQMVKHETHRPYVEATLRFVISRPDDITEFMAMYWRDGKTPIANCVKRALAEAFSRFSEYQLAKWQEGNKSIKLRDVMFLVHPNPRVPHGSFSLSSPEINTDRYKRGVVWRDYYGLGDTFADLALETLARPDTWEKALSSGENPKEAWERLLTEGKIGARALVMNLKNMIESKVAAELIVESLRKMNTRDILPFQLVVAAKYAPKLASVIEEILEGMCVNKLNGRTLFVLDTSGSMWGNLSSRSEVTRLDAGIALCIVGSFMCEESEVYVTAGNDRTRLAATAAVAHAKGLRLGDSIHEAMSSVGGGGIFLQQAMDQVKAIELDGRKIDRLIVVTDEQDCSLDAHSAELARPLANKAYLINVSTERHGIGYVRWEHIDGFSEKVFDYIAYLEAHRR